MTTRDRRLRVALLLNQDRTVPAWVGKILEEISDSEFAYIAVVIRNTAAARPRNPLRRALEQRHYLLYRLYSRLDRLLFPATPDPFEPVDARPLLRDIERLDVTPRQTSHSDYFPEETLAHMRRLRLDVCLRFGFRILRGDVLRVCRHGIWSYHHDDNATIRGGPPGFWEVLERHAATGSMLQVLTERLDGGPILARSWSPTHRRSVHRNRAHVYWKSAQFVGRELRKLHEQLTATSHDDVFHPYAGPLYRKPTNLALAPNLLKLAARVTSSKMRELAHPERWHLAWRIQEKAEDTPVELRRLREAPPPAGRFWADPFPERYGAGYLLFFEEYVEARKKGGIVGLELDEKGRVLGAPFDALERPYHLSYPFTFRYQGELFMLPESQANRTIEVYQCEGSPQAWTLKGALFEDVRAVDATLHEEEGRWWMFVNMANDEMTHLHDELYLFYARSPFGPWEPHRHNPIVSDGRRARPAGRLFRWRGKLIRPSQDCTPTYGRRLHFNEVIDLDPGRYREVPLSTIEPAWDRHLTGLHTYNRVGPLTVIDVRRRGRLFRQLVRT